MSHDVNVAPRCGCGKWDPEDKPYCYVLGPVCMTSAQAGDVEGATWRYCEYSPPPSSPPTPPRPPPSVHVSPSPRPKPRLRSGRAADRAGEAPTHVLSPAQSDAGAEAGAEAVAEAGAEAGAEAVGEPGDEAESVPSLLPSPTPSPTPWLDPCACTWDNGKDDGSCISNGVNVYPRCGCGAWGSKADKEQYCYVVGQCDAADDAG